VIALSKPFIGAEEKAAVLEVLESGMLAQGPRVAALETEWARLCGTRHAVATVNGTAALHAALLANGIGPGDEVITSAFTFAASANSILFTGARPVFADIDPETYTVDPDAVEAAITPRTRAIMPVHLYGQAANMDEIADIASRHGLAIIEDAAQAVGASIGSRIVGGYGTACFSLYATKNVMSGEGGMVTTDDDAVADQVRMLRHHGMRDRYEHEQLGYNFRLSDLHAAIGLVQLGRVEEFTRRRRVNADRLSEGITTVQTPYTRPGYGHVWHQYTVRVASGMDRDAARARLGVGGVGTGVYYPTPAHQLGYMRTAAGEFSLPETERAAREVFSLPVHPLLTDQELETIVTEVNRL
jgi:perosamine synthetase